MAYQPFFSPNGHNISWLRRRVRQIKKDMHLKLAECYNQKAREIGYSCWRDVLANPDPARDAYLREMYSKEAKEKFDVEFREWARATKLPESRDSYRLFVIAKYVPHRS